MGGRVSAVGRVLLRLAFFFVSWLGFVPCASTGGWRLARRGPASEFRVSAASRPGGGCQSLKVAYLAATFFVFRCSRVYGGFCAVCAGQKGQRSPFLRPFLGGP